MDLLSDLREVRRVMDKTAIDRRYKLKEEKGQLVNQMIEDGLKVRGCKHELYFCQSIVEPRHEKLVFGVSEQVRYK